ncbi:YtxH domain-containing protein [Neobacillus sp. NPDC093127]|uniref:YtxH domain-containing protein n=1 Tax=Neobacillus sp. NPDC093127 TaxID=3364296 RepID=UPI00380F58BD
MSETAETNKSRLWLGLLIGGVIGAAASSLLTPKSGSMLREDLSKTYKSLNEKGSQLTAVVKEKAQDVASSIGKHASELSDKANEGKQVIADTLHDVKDDIRDKSS